MSNSEPSFHKLDLEKFFSNIGEYDNFSWISKSGSNYIYIGQANFSKVDETIYSAKDKKRDLVYLEMAEVWSKNSHCTRMKVGSLIIKDKSIISDGYNGSPTGFSNVCESEENVTLPYVLHAEANAITKLAKSTQSSDGSTLYVTVSPCFECSKLIIQAGIKRLVFRDLYRKPDSLKFLHEAGIEIIRIRE
jgi:dCMP deaminase